jgi:hypothetical protein
MEFIFLSIALALFCTHLTKRCLLWHELKPSSPAIRVIAIWMIALSLPILALASRFNSYDFAQLLHHLPRSGFLQAILAIQSVLLLICWVSLEYDINRINNNKYEKIN